MPGRAVGGGVVENDQRIDGDAGPGIDQKWIDVDGSDAAAGVRKAPRHEVAGSGAPAVPRALFSRGYVI